MGFLKMLEQFQSPLFRQRQVAKHFLSSGILNPRTLISQDRQIRTDVMVKSQCRFIHSACGNANSDSLSLSRLNSLFDSSTYLIGFSRDRAINVYDQEFDLSGAGW